MNLEQKVEADLVAAMKAREAEKLGTLRLLKAAVTHHKIERKKELLEDSEVLEIIQKQAKQRRESMESFEKAGRRDLAQKEERELLYLQGYLPAALSEGELRGILTEAVRRCGAKGGADLGRVMKEVMPQVRGRADGQQVNKMLGEILK